MNDRRVNALGRLIVNLHQRYYMPRLVPVLWLLLIVSSLLQAYLVAHAR